MAFLSRARTWIAIAALLRGATPASAHIVPIPPSLCGVDPIGLTVPAMALEGQLTESAGRMRIVFDANASTIRFCPVTADNPGACADPAPWPFTLDDVPGTLSLPSRFSAVMTTSGDVAASAVPVTVTLGATTQTVPVTFTTGLALADDTVLEGAPLVGAGSWVLVGVVPGDGLPAPSDGHALALSVPCPPRPVPDKDQFVPASVVRKIAGEVAPGVTRLRFAVALGPADRPALAQGPVLVALHVDDQPIATAAIPALVRRPRRATGSSADGRATITLRSRTARRLALSVELHDVALPARGPGVRALVELTIQSPGMLARGERLFHAGADGTSLHR